MQRVCLVLCLLLASLGASRGQISVELVLEQEQFLRDEPLPIRVQISNRSGQKLALGKDTEWLTFSVENLDRSLVSGLAEIPVETELTLGSAMAGTRQVDLQPYYDLSKPGRYAITATVKIKNWNQDFVSKRKTFDIVRGTKIWEQEFGVPTQGAPDVRKYILQQANYSKRMMLYVRVSDASDTKVFRVLPLGPTVSFGRPEAQIDSGSNLHVLFQTGAHAFFYNVVSPDGDVSIRQTYEYTASRPVLKGSEDGKIFVVGGARRVVAGDVPAPLADAGSSNTPAKKP